MNKQKKLKTLGIAGQKGGVGKTTLATCLAVAAQENGLKVAIFDIDDQGSASFWHDERRKILHTESPAVISLHAVRLEAMLRGAEEEGTDLVIIDGPARHRDIAKATADVSDFILLPTRAGAAFDEKSVIQTIEVIDQGKTPFSIVFNLCDPVGFEATDAFEQSRTQPEICPVLIGKRKAFTRAQLKGLAVQEYERNPRLYSDGKVSKTDGKATKEVEDLYKYICIEIYNQQKKERTREFVARGA